MLRNFYVAAFSVLIATAVQAVYATPFLYESATLGAVGVDPSDIFSQTIPATNLKDTVFLGVRFEIPHKVLATSFGGHFASDTTGGGTFFGAIVSLSDQTDLPDSVDLTTSDVRTVGQLAFPAFSAEVFTDVQVLLQPGWYALVFGSGLFGTSAPGFGGIGAGVAMRNGVDIGDPSYIEWQPNNSLTEWNELNPIFANHRFVVQGNIVPEPPTIILPIIGYWVVIMKRYKRMRCNRFAVGP